MNLLNFNNCHQITNIFVLKELNMNRFRALSRLGLYLHSNQHPPASCTQSQGRDCRLACDTENILNTVE